MANARGQTKSESNDPNDQPKSLKRSWKSSGPVAKLTVVFAGIAALSTCVYAIFSAGQWGVMSGQLKVMQQEQRPEIIITKFDIMDYQTGKPSEEFEVGKPLEVNVRFKNVGRTSASVLHIHNHLIFGVNGIAQLRSEPDREDTPGNILGPSSEGTVTAISLVDTYSRETIALDAAQVTNWDGTEPVIVFGRVVYKDSEGKRYCTPFFTKHIPHNWVTMPSPEGLVLCPQSEP